MPTTAGCGNAPPALLPHLLFGMFTNPRAALQTYLDGVPLPFCLLISGAAFGLFYLQTGLDLVHQGAWGPGRALGLGVLGLVVGTIGVALLAGLAWALSRLLGGNTSPGWAVRALGVGYCPTLLYAALGLIANLAWGWHTSLTFGVTGVLWALGPMLAAIREMTGQQTGPAVAVTTVCGALMLAVWALIIR